MSDDRDGGHGNDDRGGGRVNDDRGGGRVNDDRGGGRVNDEHGGGDGRTVRDLALVRAGDKGTTSNVVVVADSADAYDRLEATLTADRIQERFDHLGATAVTRYEVPSTSAFNFVIEDVLAGGVTTSLRIDSHGKSLSSLVAGMPIDGDD